MDEKIPITIIGGGVVGLSIAYELVSNGYRDVALLEKNLRFGIEQSSRSSGVIHTGILNAPGTLMAKLCCEGNPLMYEFCEKNNVTHLKNGKLFVARNIDETEGIEELIDNSIFNDISAVYMLPNAIKNIEPNIRAYRGLYVPDSGIIDTMSLTRALYRETSKNHNEPSLMLKGYEVTSIEPKADCFTIIGKHPGRKDQDWSFDSEIIINAAGLASTKIAQMVNPDTVHGMTYQKGEFCHYHPNEMTKSRTSIYPVPIYRKMADGTDFYDYGIHLTPVVKKNNGHYVLDDIMLVGPKFKSVHDNGDFTNSADTEEFYEEISWFLPRVSKQDISRSETGIIGVNNFNGDFVIEEDPKYHNMFNLIGMESPSMSACLGIARYVRNMIE